MKIEKGIEIIDVCGNLKKVFPIIDLVLYEAGNHMLITGTKRGLDFLRLPHESGHAIDVARPLNEPLGTVLKLRYALGFNFKVLDMKTHLHIAYEPLCDKTLPGQTAMKHKQLLGDETKTDDLFDRKYHPKTMGFLETK